MNKCIGCGAELQIADPKSIGYVRNIDKELCERCFRIKNYGEYTKVIKKNNDYIKILKKINKTNDLVVLVLDIFNLSNNLDIIKKNITNDMILVLTKRDILPKSISDEKIIEYINMYCLKVKETIVISSYKNYNFDHLYNSINKYKKTKNVYIIGFTNAGKSTMINKLIYNYSDLKTEITTSIMPSTTIDKIEIKLNNDLKIIDTPGLLFEKSFYDILDGNDLKRIIPKKEIKPLSFQIKGKQYIIIDKYAVVELENINVVIFMSNNLKIKRIYKSFETNLCKREIKVNNNDLIINGLGFIKIIGKGNISVYTNDLVSITTRKSLV